MRFFSPSMQKRPFWILALEIFISLCVALWVQYVGGISPCTYCLYQRIFFGGAIIFFIWPSKDLMGAVLIALGILLSLYHVGLEQHWWNDVLQRCLTPLVSISEGYSVQNLRETLYKNTVVRCDTVNWRIYGISATLWTALFQCMLLSQYIFIRKYRLPDENNLISNVP